jgi:predicted ArsR family transcriptional regulator
MIEETSLLAFELIKGELGQRQKQVYEALKKIQPATNLMISKHLKIPINSITPRVKELREKKLVGVAFVDIDLNTGRPAIYWRITK